MAKPFVKWAGGKGKLLNNLDKLLPKVFSEDLAITYIEPFVGGGAILFHMLDSHHNINRVIINDINPALILCYEIIRDSPNDLIEALRQIEQEYLQNTDQASRQAFYYQQREEYNLSRSSPDNAIDNVRLAADFIFLNRTCFNGLYRENQKGGFNVPFGRYANPIICNEKGIKEASKALQKVTILCGDYREVLREVKQDEITFFYFDPPYRPLNDTASNFNDYTRHEFGDAQQEELRDFCNKINQMDIRFMVSNSDSKTESGDSYFEQIYQGQNYRFEYLNAPRVINAIATKRSPQREIVIVNY